MIKGFAFNGIHCNTYNIIVNSVDRTVLPAPNDTYLQIPNRDGSYLFNRGLLDRIIKVDCSVFTKRLTDLRSVVRQISAWLFSQQRAQLIFDDEPDKYYMAKYKDAIGLSQIVTAGKFSLIFCCEPYAYSILDTQSTTDSIVNLGTAMAYPKFTVIFTAAATEYKLLLGSNYVHVVRNYAINDVLVIDNSISKVTVNGLNAMISLDLGSRFFPLPVGGSQVIPSPLGVAQVTVNYKKRWL
jgi:predicted phage tail component-like protein